MFIYRERPIKAVHKNVIVKDELQIKAGLYNLRTHSYYLRFHCKFYADTDTNIKGDVKSVLRTFSAHNNIPMTGTVRWNFN